MAGKKRSRRSISSNVTAPTAPGGSEHLPPRSKAGADDAITDDNETSAGLQLSAQINKSHSKKKKKKQKQKEEITEKIDVSASNLNGEVRTPKPKRRKLARSTEQLEQVPKHGHGENTMKKMHQEGHQDPVSPAAEKFSNDDVVRHISIFLSGSKSPSSAASSSRATAAVEIDADNNDDHGDALEMDLDDKQDVLSLGSGSHGKEEKQMTSISYLVQFLERKQVNDSTAQAIDDCPPEKIDNTTTVDITTNDVATLLLPWSVARLMRLASAAAAASASSLNPKLNISSDGHLLAWKVLSLSLDTLSPPSRVDDDTSSGVVGHDVTTSSDAAAMLSTSLSQSTLNRLVPYAARISFGAPRNPSGVSSDPGCYASNCFVHLTRRYRPSLDTACSSLLSEVDSLVSLSVVDSADSCSLHLPSHQANAVCAMLQLIHTLMPNANPKRLFGTLCSGEVLPSFGRLMKTKPMEDLNADNRISSSSSAEEIVQKILWEGIFHPLHHMDGFRTMSELHAAPELPKLPSGGSTIEEGGEEKGQTKSSNEVATNKESAKGKGSGGGKSCFQSSLFKSLGSLLSLPGMSSESGKYSGSDGEEKEARKKAIRDAMATSNILPILIRGFFERIRARAEQQVTGGSGGGLASEADAQLQFRFWCRIMLPALEQIFHIHHAEKTDQLTLALLEAISDTLGLMLKYDVYLPSYSDPGQHHLKFLEYVTQGILQCINNLGLIENESSLDQKICSSLVTSLRHIFLLNHRLLHEKLASVIFFACSCLCRTSLHNCQQQKLAHEANDVLSVIARTYRELRQVGHFLVSTRGTFAVVQSVPQRYNGMGFMKKLLNSANIIESLSLAYQSCPSGQLHEIWDFFNGWIVNIADSDTSVQDAKEKPMQLSFAVQMFIIFIKNIRANKQNSPELRSLCEKSATTAISKLLGATLGSSPTISANPVGNQSIFMRHGFDLCGWLVDLHARSCFWVDSIDIDDGKHGFLLAEDNVDSHYLNVLEYLRNVAETTVSSDKFKKWRASCIETYWLTSTMDSNRLEEFCDIGISPPLRGSLQRLALHRIHQLHSMIYYCNLRESERHSSDLHDDHSTSQELVKEAETLVGFSFYIACSQLSMQHNTSCVTAEESLSESLWSPVAQSLSVWAHYSDSFQAEIFLIWFFTALSQNQSSIGGISEEASQFENTAALTLARDASFYDSGMVMSLFMKVGIQFAFRVLESLDANLNSEDTSERINTVSSTISFVASAPLDVSLCKENLHLLNSLVGLVMLASRVTKRAMDTHNRESPKLMKVIRSTATIITTLLPKTLIFSDDFDAIHLANELCKICFDFRFDNGILFACGDAISELLSVCIDHHEKNPNMLVDLLTRMQSLACIVADDDFSPTALLLRSFIRRMNILDRHHSLAKKSALAKSSYEMCMDFVLQVQKHLHGRIFQHLSKAGNCLDSNQVAANALLLESEILAFIGNHLVGMPDTSQMTKIQVEESRKCMQDLFEMIACAQGSQCSSEFTNASSYFLAAMTSCPGYALQCLSPSAMLESVLAMIAHSFSSGKESPLLDAALCSLIRNSGLPETKIVITLLLRKPEGGNRVDSAFITKIFHLLITCANNPEQHHFISGKSKTFLLISMGLLRDRECDVVALASSMKLFSKTLTTLISKKELLLLSGREIAMIFCEMNPLFGKQYDDVDKGTVIFKSCCMVIASLIAHYPKQLYGCPSPLFSLLLALLSHILQTNTKKGLSLKALEYAKLCELLIPHKDIFKKHVVGLVLRYIQALNDGMNPTTKSKMMPSVYALLDMCSDFEVRQINAMIDVSSKTLFGPVFQSYRKYYQYSGQA